MSADAPTTDQTIEASAGPPDGAAVPVPEMGDRIGTYRIESIAGSGGMGVVFRARDEQLDRWVALKVIAPEYARDPRFREMFLRESRAAAAIEHPNVIPVYRADEDAHRLYIAMRLVEGESLADLLARRGRISPAQAARIVGQVAAALDAAHRRGLIHRDVKPANILVGADDDTAYLSDFGLATRFVSNAAGGRWAGTLAYLAPEQIRGGTLDARTDVYALGCVMFQALTGRVPFSTRDEQAAQIAHLTQAPPRVSETAPGVPAGFDALVARAMAKRPDDRFPSARAFADALAALRFDAVLVHHPADAAAAAELRSALRGAGLEVWEPSPGADDIAEALRASASCVVLVGAQGLGDWAREPLSIAQDVALRDRAYRIGAALLPGCPDPFGPGMAFLAGRRWADLRLGTADRDGRRELVRLVREEPPPPPGDGVSDVSPYPGLAPFGERDAGVFVGREDEVAMLLERLRGRRFLAVVAPSGSGKTSLLHAGLLPALREDPAGTDWRIAAFAPGTRPLAALSAAVAPLVSLRDRPQAGALGTDPSALRRALEDTLPADGSDARILLLVDQFEEVFTLAEPDERGAFLDALVDVATLPGGRVWVVAAMRADFYQHCAEHGALRDLVASNQFLLGPMGPAALRRAIEVPARRSGLVLETGLTRHILNDLAGRPGALPLLQHLLLELWHRRRGRELTLEAYAASGGVEGALARRADTVHAELTPQQQALARRILLRLTQPGEGTEDTRRRAELRELVTDPAEHADVDAVVGAFTAARLLTTSRDASTGRPTVEVAHEALIRGWPRLRRWIADEREALVAQHRLTQAADEWERADRDEGHVYRGARLAAWRERDRAALNDRERGFLAASEQREGREALARRRRTRIAMAALAAGVIAVGGAAGYARLQRNDAVGARAVAQSRQLAANARDQVARDPELGVLLAQAAMDADPTPDARWALRQTVFTSPVVAGFRIAGGAVRLAVSRDGTLLLTGSIDGVVRKFDLATGRATGTLPGDASFVLGLDVDATGSRYAVTSGSTADTWPQRVEVRTVEGGRLLRSVRVANARSAAISPDGRLVASAGADGAVTVWRVDGTAPGRVIGRMPGEAIGLAFSRDGSHVGAGGSRGETHGVIGVWRSDGGGGRTAPVENPGGGVAFAPDGETVAVTGFSTPDLYRWRWADASAAPANARTDVPVLGVAWSPDGRWIATTATDGGVSVRPAGGGEAIVVLQGHKGQAFAVAFAGGPDRLVTVGEDGVRRWVWSRGVPERVDIRSGEAGAGEGRRLAISDDGAVTAMLPDGRIAHWPAGSGAERTVTDAGTGGAVNDGVLGPGGTPLAWTSPSGGLAITRAGGGAPFSRPGFWSGVDVTPDGRTAVAGKDVGQVIRWRRDGSAPPVIVGRLPTGTNSLRISADGSTILGADFTGRLIAWHAGTAVRMTGHTGSVPTVDVTADGSIAASGSGDRTVRVWDTRTGRQLAVLRGHAGPIEGSVEFSGDARTLASAATDGVRLWDWRGGGALLALPVERPNDAAVSDDGTWVATVVPRRGFYRLLRWRCDVCGPISDVERLAVERVTRALSEGEREQFGIR
ncbi:MAG: protein kinase [Thermoleophilia bacterium]|nr:protein kinase [Thermoleophilia bacterium]